MTASRSGRDNYQLCLKKYTIAGRGGRDKYELWFSAHRISPIRIYAKYSHIDVSLSQES